MEAVVGTWVAEIESGLCQNVRLIQASVGQLARNQIPGSTSVLWTECKTLYAFMCLSISSVKPSEPVCGCGRDGSAMGTSRVTSKTSLNSQLSANVVASFDMIKIEDQWIEFPW